MKLRTRYTQRYPTASRLVLNIPFFEGSGTKAMDVSGKSNHGNIEGASWSTSEKGGCLNFNGSSDYVNCGNDESLNITDSVTIETWVMDTEWVVDLYQHLMSKWYNWYLQFPPAGDSLGFGIIDSSDEVHTARYYFDFLVDTWYHIFATYDGDTNDLKLYIEGVQKADGSSPDIKGGTFDLHISSASWGVAGFFKGMTNYIRIYDRVLPLSEIKRCYEQSDKDYCRGS